MTNEELLAFSPETRARMLIAMAAKSRTQFSNWEPYPDGIVKTAAKTEEALYSVGRQGGKPIIKWNFHEFQIKAMQSARRFIVLLAGTQGGKTSFAPIWLYREIKACGAGDYLFVAPTYKLMQLKALPEFLRLFETTFNLGTLNKAEKVFTFSERGEIDMFGKKQDTPTKIFFGHAQDPDSLESATAKGAVLDECGQKKFKLGSFEAIMRRLSIHMGRVLMTTTPYYLGWLKRKFWDVWKDANEDHPEIDVIRFPSIANPAFPQAEYERAKRTLPAWKFKMFYQAIFTRPAGLIYDCFDESQHVIEPVDIPADWKRWYLGLDFGGVNTAAVYLVKNPGGGYIVTREYLAGGRTIKGHTSALSSHLPPGSQVEAFGGSKSEQQWRDEFGAAGLFVDKPAIAEVELGIDKVYEAISTGMLKVFSACEKLIDELLSYSRVVDDSGEPTEKIEDKNKYHLLDALRYVCSFIVDDGAYDNLVYG